MKEPRAIFLSCADFQRNATVLWVAVVLITATAHAQQQRYDHGDPTIYEQFLLEMVNTARTNPSAEATRLGIGLNDGLGPGSITADAKDPLAFHPQLTAAARNHSRWMLQTGVFSHTGVNGSSPTQRAQQEGYLFSVGENIGYRSTNVVLAPAVLAVLTRASHNALFRSAGHRRNLLAPNYTVAGFGIRTGVFDGFNAAMATQKFSEGGETLDSGPFILGVAYRDGNGNGSYDPGEGLAGVEVRPDTGNYYAVTSSSGGYAIPVVPAQTNTQTVTLPFALAGTPWASVLPHDQAYRAQQHSSAERVQINLTWSGGPLSAPVRTAVDSTRAVRLNYILQGTDGVFYDRTMVTARSVRANLDVSAAPTPTPPAGPAEQSVTFSPLKPVAYAPGRVIQLQARASSGLPLTFTSSDPMVAEVSDGKISVRGAGQTTITARQEGNEAYLPAEATRRINVRKARQTVIFPAPVRPRFSPGATFELAARATSGEAVSYTTQPSGLVSITGSTATMLAPGKVKIIATQADSPNYKGATISRKILIR